MIKNLIASLFLLFSAHLFAEIPKPQINNIKSKENIQLKTGDPIRISFGIVEISKETGDLYKLSARSHSQDPNSPIQDLLITLPSLLTDSENLGIVQGTTIIGDTVWDFILRTIISENNGRIIANTFGITDDNQLLSLDSSSKEPYQTIKVVGLTNQIIIEFLDVGVKANVTPTIDEIKQTIKLKLDFEVSEILKEEEKKQENIQMQVPVRSVRHIITNISIKPNQYIIIGGLDREKKMAIINGIPFLRRIPILGILFSSKETKIMKTKLYIIARATPPLSVDLSDFEKLKEENTNEIKPKFLDKLK